MKIAIITKDIRLFNDIKPLNNNCELIIVNNIDDIRGRFFNAIILGYDSWKISNLLIDMTYDRLKK